MVLYSAGKNPFSLDSKEPTASYTPCGESPRCVLVLRTTLVKDEPPRSNLRSRAGEQAPRHASLDYHFFINGEARYTRLAQQFPERAKEVSPAGSVTSGSDSPPDCHSTPSVSLRYFEKAEQTAKAKYERLKKLVEFYNV